MPAGPHGQKRPGDVVGCAVHVATEIEETPQATRKHERGVGGKAGGKARAASLTATERSQIPRKAACASWSNPQSA